MARAAYGSLVRDDVCVLLRRVANGREVALAVASVAIIGGEEIDIEGLLTYCFVEGRVVVVPPQRDVLSCCEVILYSACLFIWLCLKDIRGIVRQENARV
jgi:hypothetical protein